MDVTRVTVEARVMDVAGATVEARVMDVARATVEGRNIIQSCTDSYIPKLVNFSYWCYYNSVVICGYSNGR